MARATRICKICGKEYDYCRTETNNKFRWQDVACCPEHGAEYFKRIEESRANKKTYDIDEPSSVVTSIEDELLVSDELAEEFVIDRMYNSEEAVG